MLGAAERANVNGSGIYDARPTANPTHTVRIDKVMVWAMISVLAIGVAWMVTRSDTVHHQIDNIRARMTHSEQDRAAIHKAIDR